MPTIIDALLVTLNLDPAGFKKGTREAEQVADAADKKRDNVNKKGDKEQRERARKLKLEEEERKKLLDKTTGSIADLGRTLAGAVLGFEGIKGGINYLANMNANQAALGRTASRLGIDPSALNIWGKAVELAGGKAEDAGQTIADLVKQFQQLKTVGGTPGPLLTLLQQFSVPYRDLKGNLLDISTIFKNLSAKMAGMDEQTRSATLARAGVSQGLIDLFNETQAKQQQEIAAAVQFNNVTRQGVQAAEDLKRQFDGTVQSVDKLGQRMLKVVTPATKDALSAIQKGASGDTRGAGDAAMSAALDVGDIYTKWAKWIYSPIGGDKLIDAIGALFEDAPNSRAARNNNPGNIKAVGNQPKDAQGFRIFASQEEGAQAMQANIARKLAKGNDTIKKLIEAYEGTDTRDDPKATAAYIARVQKSTGIGDRQITEADLPSIMAAMVRQESGLMDSQHAARTPNGATPGIASGTVNRGTAGASAAPVTNVTIENQNINAPSADPNAVANQVGEATARKITMAQANGGQS